LADTDNTVKYIAVHPEFQAYKIGSGLLTRLLGDMGDARSVRLQTAGDTRLVSWYGRFGFRAESELYGDAGNFLGAFMVRRQRCRSAGL
jgi:ribosomal protein S18 acetylase RimI-like enzyme